MKAAELPIQSVPLTDAKARLPEYVRAIENGGPSIQITRHGKVVAKITKPDSNDETPMTVASWIGGGTGTLLFADDYDEQEPTWADDEWEMHKDEDDS